MLNIVHGTGRVGAAITAHPDIHAISFTGGTRTGGDSAHGGTHVQEAEPGAGRQEPVPIFDDCDFEAMLRTTVRSSFHKPGADLPLQVRASRSSAASRPASRDAFVERVKALKVGDPKDPASDLGAVVSEPHMEKVLSLRGPGAGGRRHRALWR